MERTLGDVHPKYHFITKDGRKIKNLRELYSNLKGMDDITYNHHVNDFKNDFHNWVRDVHKDNQLAEYLLASETKKEMAQHLRNRIEELESVRAGIKDVEEEAVKEQPKIVKKAKPVARKRKPRVKAAAVQEPVVAQEIENIPQKAEESLESTVASEAQPITLDQLRPEPKQSLLLKMTVGDFALGLVIGTIAGIIISKLI